jgi:PAS domain S-box-containing protein
MHEIRVSDLEPQESDELLKSFFADSALGLSITDLSGRFVRVNPAYCLLIGYAEAELKACDFQSITHPDDLPKSMAKIEALLAGKISSCQIEERNVRKDENIIRVLHNISLGRDQGGQPSHLIRLSQDISTTEEGHAQAALRISEERYRELFENAKDALYVHDLSGRYTSFNRAAEELSGFSRAEILGKHFSNFVAPGSLKNARENLCKKLDMQGETTYEIELVRKDRSRVPVEIISRLIYENGEPVGIQGVARDITDRKRAQEALLYSRRLIEAQMAEKQVIARELHDEVGQILTKVRMNLQSLAGPGPPELQPARIDQSLAVVDEALKRVRELSLNLRPSVLDNLGLNSALRWYVDRYSQQSGVVADLQSDLEEDRRLSVELETACFQIVQEALTNIARHARATHVLVRLRCANGSLDLKVIDNGVGFNVDALIRDAPPDMALGLRGMREGAIAARGHFQIESAPMRGTEVRASFPLKE